MVIIGFFISGLIKKDEYNIQVKKPKIKGTGNITITPTIEKEEVRTKKKERKILKRRKK